MATPGKIDFKTQNVTKGREVHFLIMKLPIYQENITIINIYTTNYRTPKYVKKNCPT